MNYREGYLYQLADREVFRDTQIRGYDISTEFIELTPGGVMIVKAGYAWDGASWAWDTISAMHGSCGHDSLFQLLRQGHLPQSVREAADKAFGRWLKQDGMWAWRANLWVATLGIFGAAAADPANKKEVLFAP